VHLSESPIEQLAPEDVVEARAPFFPPEAPESLASAGVVVALRNRQVVVGASTSPSVLSRTLDLVDQTPKSLAVL
jgi:hypothetical protein